MATSGAARLDTIAARNAGTGPQNIISGRGEQFNNTISGGSGNTQYINQSFHTPSESSAEELDLDFRKRLFVTDPAIDRANLIGIKGARVPKTCEWIRKTNEYTSWHDEGTGRPLWIWGEPGKGKTMLSIFLSQELETEAKTIYFFCSADDGKRNTAVAILRGLLWHLTTLFPKLTRGFREKFESNLEAAISSREVLWTTLTELIGSVDCNRLYCIIDGLDECEEGSRQWLAVKLMSMPSANTIKLAIFSRKLLELRDSLQVKLNTDYHENVNWAVEAFSDARSEELFSRITCSDEHQALIKATLLDKAGDTFLWIAFAVTELMKQENVSRVLDLLEDLPAGFSPCYGRMVQNIDAHERKEGLRILGYVTYASRPLDLMELATLVGRATREGITPCQNIRGLIAGYGPLLHVAKQTELGPVSLVHESLRDYLDKGDFPAGVHMSAEYLHAHIARTCLDSLGNRDSPLLEYAEVFWPQHARASGKQAKEILSHRSSFFHKNPTLRNEWWRTTLDPPLWTHETRMASEPRTHRYHLSPAVRRCCEVSRLHMACSTGFKPWIDDILEKHNSWLSRRFYLLRRDFMGHTAIVHAVVEGHTEIVIALLQYTSVAKYLINATNGDKGALLHYAASYSQFEVAKLLLLRHANVNTRNEKGETALHYARDEAMVKLLVDYGANVKATGKDNGTALHVACNEAGAKILIEHGASVDAKDHNGDTALHRQTQYGHQETVKLLLKCGADVNSTNRQGRTALYTAPVVWTDRMEAIRKLLIDNGADANAGTPTMRETALQNAAHRGDEWIAKIMLDHGADVNGRDRFKETALYNAARRGHEATVRLLLDYGADVNGRNALKETALHKAVSNGHEAIVRLLLDHGADIDGKSTNGKMALHVALESYGQARVAIARLLLDRGADLNAKDCWGTTARRKAIDGSHEAMAKMVLEYGADIQNAGEASQ